MSHDVICAFALIKFFSLFFFNVAFSHARAVLFLPLMI